MAAPGTPATGAPRTAATLPKSHSLERCAPVRPIGGMTGSLERLHLSLPSLADECPEWEWYEQR